MDTRYLRQIFSAGIFFLFVGGLSAQDITEPAEHWTMTKHLNEGATTRVGISGPVLEVDDGVEGGAAVAFKISIEDTSSGDAESSGLWLALRTSQWPAECQDLDLNQIQAITYMYKVVPKSLELVDSSREVVHSLRTGVTQEGDRGHAFANSKVPLQVDGEWHKVEIPVGSLVVERVEGQTEDWDLTDCGAFWVAMGGFDAYSKADFTIQFAAIRFVPKS